MARKSDYSPAVLPLVRCAAHFGATRDEIANYLGIARSCFDRWCATRPELQGALKRGREASNERVVESLYKQAVNGNVVACVFWLKNRLPSEWRDIQHIDQAVGHYIIADRPLSEQEWIEQRTLLNPPEQTNNGEHVVVPTLSDTASE